MYEVSGGPGDRNCVVLNDIHIDIMDYIVPATCTDSEFRQMWAEFEWENKVTLGTKDICIHEGFIGILNCRLINERHGDLVSKETIV